MMKKLIPALTALFVLISTVPVSAETAVLSDNVSSEAFVEVNYPSITSDYLYLEDADTGQVLWSVNPDEKIYPASMTKMMTEILAIEALSDTSSTITITSEMLSGLSEANATVAGFAVGDTPTVLDCLYGAALPSGADAVNALAITVSGSIDAFVDLMNQKAAELGMTNTHFTNATGLYDDNHYSTVHDIAILMKYCLNSDLFHSLISTPSYTTTTGLVLNSTFWKYLTAGGGNIDIPGFEGAKTGYTSNAGNCFASTGTENGIHIILVTAHSMSAHGIVDASTVYPWIASTFEKRTVLSAGDQLLEVSVKDTIPTSSFTITADTDVTVDLPIGTELTVDNTAESTVYAPVNEGDSLGTYTIKNGDEVLYTQELTSPVTIKRNELAYIWRMITEFVSNHPLLSVFYAAVIAFLLVVASRHIAIARKRRRRRKRKQQRQKRNS
jgi:D-alanyl-D-alanine carboxypeptidase